jgi:hypothetical protein
LCVCYRETVVVCIVVVLIVRLLQRGCCGIDCAFVTERLLWY